MFGIIIPAHNEQRTVGATVRECRSLTGAVLVIDDGSTDDTSAIARAEGAQVVKLPRQGGLGAALSAGFAKASELGWSTVLTCDADGAHDLGPAERALGAHKSSSAVLTLGSRTGPHGRFGDLPDTKAAANRVVQLILNQLSGAQVQDWLTGFRVLQVEAFARTFSSQGFSISVELILHCVDRGLKLSSVPIEVHYPADELWLLKRVELRDFLMFCARRWDIEAFRQGVTLAQELRRHDVRVQGEQFALHPLREEDGYLVQAYERGKSVPPDLAAWPVLAL